MGFQLFGDSQGRVQVYEKNVQQSTLDVLAPPKDSALLDGQPGALERFQEDCGSPEIVAIVPFARGFAAATVGGYLSVCGVLRKKCEPCMWATACSTDCSSLRVSACSNLPQHVSLSMTSLRPLGGRNGVPAARWALNLALHAAWPIRRLQWSTSSAFPAARTVRAR